jgi:hypothetical protein
VKGDRPDGRRFYGQDRVPEEGDDDAVRGVEVDGARGSVDESTDESVHATSEIEAAGGEGGGTAIPAGDEVTGDPAESGDEADVEAIGDEDQTREKPPSSGRVVTFAVLRAVVVLVVAGVTYQLVVPTTDVVRGRLARLVITKPGVAAYDKAKPQAGEQNVSQTGIGALTVAAKRSPKQTGLYSIEWSPSTTSAAGIVAFLLPSDSDARTAMSQIRAQQLAAGSHSSNSLTRQSTYAVSGVPGSYAAVYRPPAKDAGSLPSLGITVFRSGRVVAVSEAISTGSSARPAADTITRAEYANLLRVGPGFSLSVTRYPVVATTLWVVGAIVLAAIAALAPIARRRRAVRRKQAYEEEMAHRVIVGKQVIVKHRR